MKWIVVLLTIFCTNLHLYSMNDSTVVILPGGYVSGSYNWDDAYTFYGLKLGISVPSNRPESLSLLYEINGGFGKLNDKNLWGMAAMQGLRLSYYRGMSFLFLDFLSGFGGYYFDGKDKGIFGVQAELRGMYGISSFSLGILVNAFVGNGLSFSGKGLILSWHF